MRRQVVQATILCLAAIQFCGCASGFRWPWSKKPADADLSAADPDLATATPAIGSSYPSATAQNAPLQNSQLPSGYSGPAAGPSHYAGANAQAATAPTYGPNAGITQRSGYGGGFADTSTNARPALAPADAPVGYDTASTYNAPPAGAVYPPPAYQAATNAPAVQGAGAPVGAWSNGGAAPAVAGLPPQAYPPPANYGPTPPPGGAYPQGATPYAGSTSVPSVAAAPMTDANNPYRGPRYTLTSSRPPSPSSAAESTQGFGAAQPAAVPAQNGRYPAADPFGPPTAAPVSNSPPAPAYGQATYGPPPPIQQSAAPGAALGTSAANGPPAAAPVYGPPAGAPVPDGQFGAPYYHLPPGGAAGIEPIAVDTHPPVPAPTVENHYATGDPLAASQTPATAPLAVAQAPAAQPMLSGSQLSQIESTAPPAPAPRAAAPVSAQVVNADPPPVAAVVPPLPPAELGFTPSQSSMRKLGKPGEPVKAKRSAQDSKPAANSRPKTRYDLAPQSDDASSRFKNPLRDSD